MIDYSLYLVTDRELSRGRSLAAIIGAAVEGGVTCVQLREKDCSTREFMEEARTLKDILTPLGIPLIINDRIDIAMAVGADGVHLGQKDMDLEDARKITQGSLVIGISAESLEDAVRAQWQGADYIGISPVFNTSTKMDTAPPLGLDGVKLLSAAVNIPAVGIGGINLENAASVIKAGADGIAVVSAIVSAEDPARAARELKQQCEMALKRQEES